MLILMGFLNVYIEEFKTKERETRALINASKALNCQNLLVITENYEAEERISWFGVREP